MISNSSNKIHQTGSHLLAEPCTCMSVFLIEFFSGSILSCRTQFADRVPFHFSSGGAIPDAAAIYAARKRREAAREGRTGAGGSADSPSAAHQGSKDYLPINKKSRWEKYVHCDLKYHETYRICHMLFLEYRVVLVVGPLSCVESDLRCYTLYRVAYLLAD